MTREQVKDLLPFLQAFANGEPIQALCNNEWCDTGDDPDIDPRFCKYRVKPKETYRPFNNCKECWKEMQKHVPFGWIASKKGIEHYHIDYISDPINKVPFMLRIDGSSFNFADIFDDFTFPDGTPFGIKEEEK